MRDFDATVAGLRKWTESHDPHVRAAVELLIDDGRWLRRRDFTSECVRREPSGEVWISWLHARDFIAANRAEASRTEMAFLELAVALARDTYRFNHMDDDQARQVVTAFAAALGMERMLRG